MPELPEAPCILILDLATDNAISERSIEPRVPSGPDSHRRIYRVTDFGASATPQGQARDPRAWHEWTGALDRMLDRARADLGDDRELAHYYVAGRAGLPIFTYLGVRLARQARITAINLRPDGEWDVVPLQKPPSGADTAQPASSIFFDQIKGLSPDVEYEGTGKVAVFVSTQRDSEPAKIRGFAASLGVPLAGIVTIRARPDESSGSAYRWLGNAHGPGAALELVQHLATIQDRYPHHEGLIVCTAGPATLALMVGRAINPRIHAPVWVPNFNRAEYEPAIEIPWPLVSGGKPRILIATANPPDEQGRRLDIETDLKALLRILELEVGAQRADYKLLPAVELDQLMDALRSFQPHILHFSGHGELGGLVFRSPEGNQDFVPTDGLEEMIRTTATELRLIVLCACQSTHAARALTSIADCVVGTTANVDDMAAIQFSWQFYAALTQGAPVQAAFDQGHARARAGAGGNSCEFKLHPRPGVDPAQIVLFSPAHRGS